METGNTLPSAWWCLFHPRKARTTIALLNYGIDNLQKAVDAEQDSQRYLKTQVAKALSLNSKRAELETLVLRCDSDAAEIERLEAELQTIQKKLKFSTASKVLQDLRMTLASVACVCAAEGGDKQSEAGAYIVASWNSDVARSVDWLSVVDYDIYKVPEGSHVAAFLMQALPQIQVVMPKTRKRVPVFLSVQYVQLTTPQHFEKAMHYFGWSIDAPIAASLYNQEFTGAFLEAVTIWPSDLLDTLFARLIEAADVPVDGVHYNPETKELTLDHVKQPDLHQKLRMNIEFYKQFWQSTDREKVVFRR